MDMFMSVDIIKRMMKMLGAHYGVTSEFILHDMRNGPESTVIAIENNNLTGRNVGDCSSNLGFGLLRFEGKSEINDSYGYNVYFKDGRVFRSSTMYFKDDNGKMVGSFCINTDITPLMNMQGYIETLTPCTDNPPPVEEFFPHDVNELLDILIDNHAKKTEKDGQDLTKEEKLDAIRYFDSHGAFLISKAGPKICKYLAISKGTLYSYLSMVREEEAGST